MKAYQREDNQPATKPEPDPAIVRDCDALAQWLDDLVHRRSRQ